MASILRGGHKAILMKTVLLTGITGYIAKHIAAQLLDAGYAVRGSMRSMKRVQEVNAAVAKGVTDPSVLTRLSFCELDLTKDMGWNNAAMGVDAVIHTASPFPMTPPKSESDLTGPAKDGMLRALKAAAEAKVERVIITSSTAAISGAPLPDGKAAYDEDVWSDTESKTLSAYSKSKTLAERAAWDFVKSNAPEMKLTSINPGFVLGAPLDNEFGTSVAVIQRILRGKDPMVPQIGFTTVDVKDVAALHVKALTDDTSVGKRVMAVDQFLWFVDFAKLIKAEFSNRRIPTRVAPNVLIKVLGLFDPAIRGIIPQLGESQKSDNSRARAMLGRDFIDAKDSAVETARYLVDKGLV